MIYNKKYKNYNFLDNKKPALMQDISYYPLQIGGKVLKYLKVLKKNE